MDDFNNETTDNDSIISKIYQEIEFQKEEKFVNLITEIIVSITLKELYEEGDKIFTIQSVGTKQRLD